MRDRGFALLIVLWSLGLLALLGTALMAMGRTEIHIANNTRDAAVAEAAADGGLQHGIFMVQQGAWMPDGVPHVLHVGSTIVEVRASDQAGKVNPNTATIAMLQALLTNVGVGAPRASSLARAIVDWRIRSLVSLSGGTKLEQYHAAGLPYSAANRPFGSIDEIGLVLGLTGDLLARLRPWISIYQEGDVQGPTAGILASSASEESGPADPGGHNIVAKIDATANVPGRARFSRRAVVRFKARSQRTEAPFQILTWETPED